MSAFPTTRLRRLREHPQIRRLVRDVQVSVDDLVLPLFIKAGKNLKHPIASMPGHYQFSVDQLAAEIETIRDLNIPAVILFGIPAIKNAMGSQACDANGVVQQATQLIKKIAPELLVIIDLCYCEYTDHGHCGVVKKTGEHYVIDNDATLKLLGEQAVSHVKAGADVIAPSGMMDGMVQAIRKDLDAAGFTQIPILSYAVKYASHCYGPFREAAEGAPKFGDRSSYQMDPANRAMALREAQQDVQEGADMLMVKPAQFYLDIIFAIKQQFPAVPLSAYQVSGEYAMIKAAGERGWIDEQKVMVESLLAIKRAGADFIITYFAKDFAKL